MMIERRRPTLTVTVTADTLPTVLAAAKARCDAYFDGVPYEFVRCDAEPVVRSHGGDVLLYEADVTAAAIPQRTGPPPWQSDRATTDDPHPPGYFEADGGDSDDDTKEVPIQ